MRCSRQLTRWDATVLVLSVLLLLNLAAVGESGREQARRAVCLAHLKQLTQAWRLFALDHDGRIVNGAAGMNRYSGGTVERAWVGMCWASDYGSGGRLPEDHQKYMIREGALWPYVQESRLYRCPRGYPGQMLTYAIVASMNGLSKQGTAYGGVGIRIDDTVLWVKKLEEIVTPGPAERMVFVDVGRATPDSFAVHYTREDWWDGPPVHHGNGTSVSFADGHCEYWRWKGEETIQTGLAYLDPHTGGYPLPRTPQAKEDLHRFQIAVWGRLGYTPSQP
jgi:prepilin-type processing-associated H-X9-DG protein